MANSTHSTRCPNYERLEKLVEQFQAPLLDWLTKYSYDALPQNSPHLRERSRIGKEVITFSDMIISVRHYLWVNWGFEQVPAGAAVLKLPLPIRKLLDFGLTQAA